MRPSELIIDASVLFSFFDPDSFRRKLVGSLFIKGVRLYVPQYGLSELFSLKDEICKACEIDEDEFVLTFALLCQVIHPFPKTRYKEFISRAETLFPEHTKDAPYFALAFSLNKVPLWSDEKRHKQQEEIKVFSTSELAKLDI